MSTTPAMDGSYVAIMPPTSAPRLMPSIRILWGSDEAVSFQLREDGRDGVLGERAAKIRRTRRFSIAGLGNGDGQVASFGEAVEFAPRDEVLAAVAGPFLVAVEENNGGPRAVSGGLLQKCLDPFAWVVGMTDEECVGGEGFRGACA